MTDRSCRIRIMSGYGRRLFPQMRSALGPIFGDDIIHEWVVSEINIAVGTVRGFNRSKQGCLLGKLLAAVI